MNYKQLIEDAVQEKSSVILELSDRTFDLAEVGFREFKTVQLYIDALKQEGFDVECGLDGMPTAFKASYGSGKPVIGYLAEYDALPDLSQKANCAERCPAEEGGPNGHGCGHNNLGVGAVGAALALKDAIAAGRAQGTVRFYGCPAEETLVGKVFMVRDGAFEGVDCAMTWHSHAYNGAWGACYTCMNSVKFHFHGKAAHAAGHPFDGRSALDAVELMNVSANYMREHVKPDVRIHYATICSCAPNVVPDECSVWYYIRAPKRRDVDEVYSWLCDCARGAALMTQTTFDIEFLTGCSEVMPNDVLEKVMLQAYQDTGAPRFTPEDHAFAEKMAETYPDILDRDRRVMKEEYGVDGDGKFLCDVVFDKVIEDRLVAPGSTDVGDVSHVVPTYQIYVAGQGIGCPGHSWQMTAYSGHHVGFASMLCAAKVLALSGLRLLEDPQLVQEAWDNFHAHQTEPYVSPLPEGLMPDLEQVKN